jgi:hypothetical protein
VTVFINRLFVDFEKEAKVYHNGELTVSRVPQRNGKVITKSIEERMDPWYIFED